MKQAWLAALAAAILTFVLPVLALDRLPATEPVQTADEAAEADESAEIEEEELIPEEPDPKAASVAALPVSGTLPEDSFDDSVTLTLLSGDTRRELSLTEYLTGVVAGELTDSFADDALKAQAVAARTYALRQLGAGKHDGALCSSPGCCQSWTDPVQKAQTPAGADLVLRARQAVQETDGQVLTYEGELIEALYFSCSGGRTEAAGDVWGREVPYLQAVDSPGEETLAPRYQAQVCLTAQELETLLAPEGIVLSEDPADWFGTVTHTQGGGVALLTVGGQALAGTRLRALLSLNSTAFTVSWDGTAFTFTTLGFGHRVGLSQYGAQAMALAGSTYGAILSRYYPGTELTGLSPGDFET